MVGKRNEDVEGDLFPRGAAPQSTPRVRKRNGQTLFASQVKRPRPTRPSETLSDAPVTQHGATLSMSRLSVGMTVLGLITKADHSGIELVLPGGLRGAVPKDEFLTEESLPRERMQDSDDESSVDSDEEEASVRPAWQVVNVGNIVPAAIVDIEVNNHGKKVVLLSLKPHLVNVGLNPSHILRKDFTLYGAVKSVEDHGYVISFGANIPHTAFLPFEKQENPEAKHLFPGSPFTVVTSGDVKMPKKRKKNFTSSVHVSALRNDVLSAVIDVEAMTYQDLKAGMLLRSRVLKEGPGGVSLSAFGIFSIDVDASHVPRKPDGSSDVTTGESALARLLYVDPTSKRIGASLLHSYVSELSPRVVPSHWRTGTRMRALVVERVKPGFGLILRSVEQQVDDDDDIETHGDDDVVMNAKEGHLIPIFAHISRVSDSKELSLESKYPENTVVRDGARVVSISKFDGVVNVDLRPSVLSRKALSLDEIEIGVIYACKILSHTSAGALMVAVDGDPYLSGVVLPLHISDVPIPSKRLAKNPAYRVGSSIRCRALSVRQKTGKVFLTARKSLVSSKYPILTSYTEAADALLERKTANGKGQEGFKAPMFTGITGSITSKGDVIVFFCDKVAGLIPLAELSVDRGRHASHAEIENLYPIGETIHVRVVTVKEKERRMYLSTSLESRENPGKKKNPFELGQRLKTAISAVDTSSNHFIALVPVTQLQTKLKDELQDGHEASPLQTGKHIECQLPFGHLSDNPGVAERLVAELKLRLTESGSGGNSSLQIPEAMVLCYRDDTPVLTLKTSLMKTFEDSRLPKSFDDVKQLGPATQVSNKGPHRLRGYIKALLPIGVIVGFLGDCVGFIRNSRVADRFISDPARCLEIHQSVSTIVESIDEGQKRFSLSMRPSDIGPSGMETDTLSLFSSLQEWQKLLGIPQSEAHFRIGSVTTAERTTVSAYGVKYNLTNKHGTAVGVVYGVSEGVSDVVMSDSKLDRKGKTAKTKSETPEFAEAPDGAEERVRILDVDPLTGVVDLSRDQQVVSEGEKKSVISPGASLSATVLLVKSAYIILAVRRSKSRTVIAYALNPVTQENLMIRPGAEIKCTVLDKKMTKTHRNLVIVNWDSFRDRRNNMKASLSTQDSEIETTLACLKASAGAEETSFLGMKITGKVTHVFPLYAYAAVAPGVVGHIHITNVSSMTSEELAETQVGAVSSVTAAKFALPKVGNVIQPAFLAGVRRHAGQDETGPIVVEVSLSKERCFAIAPCEGEKRLGFVKKPSSRLREAKKCEKEKAEVSHTLVAVGPGILVSCADVDCLSSTRLELREGTPVVCRVNAVEEDVSGRVRGALSKNGAQRGSPFLGLVVSVHPGRGLRVAIPWLARDSKAKSVAWGFVDICDVGDDFDQAVNIMQQTKSGSVVTIHTVMTTQDDSGKFHVYLSMRVSGQITPKDPLVTASTCKSLKNGSHLRGFVQGIGKKGCFVSIGRNVIARVRLCDLSDEFVKDPEKEFPVGMLVAGHLENVSLAKNESKFELVLRKRPKKKLRSVSIPSELSEGSKVSGSVRRVTDYGALVEIAPGLTALLHKSEADQDRFIEPRQEWLAGQNLTAIVIKVDGEKISVGTKRCYFEAAGIEDIAIDEILATNEENKKEVTEDKEMPDKTTDAVVGMQEQENIEAVQDEKSDSESDCDVQDDTRGNSSASLDTMSDQDTIPNAGTVAFVDAHVGDSSATPLVLGGGFDFADTQTAGSGEHDDSDLEANDNKVENNSPVESAKSKSRDKREKKRAREAAERDIRLREEALAKNPDAPETADDFERLLMGEPNSSVMWIRYMAFCLQLSQVDRARSIAERALETISLQSETERVNLWCAYVNLEAQFGSMNSAELEASDALGAKRAAAVFRVFERACERITDVKSFHLQVSAALRLSFPELADEVLKRAVRKFKGSRQVWMAIGQSQFANGDIPLARKTLERALISIEKREHISVITKFAQFEYRYGSAERGRTVFESLIGNFPKRVDLWNIYLDMESSQCQMPGEEESNDESVARARKLFERFASLNLNSKKMKFAFKKWLTFEKTYGTKQDQSEVKNRARLYVDRNMSEQQ